MAVGVIRGALSHASASADTSHASFTFALGQAGDAPRGVLVFVFQGSTSMTVGTDLASSVTYGGTTVPAVSGGFAVDTAGELGSCKAFFLGASVPSGAPTGGIVVNRTNSAVAMWAVGILISATTDTQVNTAGIVLLQEDGAYAVQSVDDANTTGTNSLRFAGGYYGGSTPAPAGTGSTVTLSTGVTGTNDMGVYGWTVVKESAAGTGARNVGMTQVTSDDRAAVHLAVRETVTSAAPSAIIYQATTAQPHPTVVATSPALEVSGFGTFTGVGAADTVVSVKVTANAFASDAGMGAPAYELWDGTSSIIGTAQAGTASTSNAHLDVLTFTGATYAQLATLRVRVYGHSGTALSGAIQYVDWVSLTVAYVSGGAAPAATLYAVSAAFPASSHGDTAPAAIYGTSGTFPAVTARQDQAPAATLYAATAVFPASSHGDTAPAGLYTVSGAFPAVTASGTGSATATAALYAVAAAFPAPSAVTSTKAAPAAYATTGGYPAATVTVPGDSPALEVSGFGTFTGISAGDTVNSVTVTINQFASSALMAAPTFELWDGTSAKIGATQTGTASTTSAHTDTATFTGVTYAQLATLRVRVYAHPGTAASGAALSVDYVSLTAAYTPGAAAPGTRTAAAVFPAVTVTASSGAAPAAALYATAAVFPAATVRLDAAPAPAVHALPFAQFPNVTAGGGAAATAVLYTVTAGFPAPSLAGGAVATAVLYATSAVSQFDPAGSSVSIQLIADTAYTAGAVFPPASVSTTVGAVPAASLYAVTAAQPAPAAAASVTAALVPFTPPVTWPPPTASSSAPPAAALYAVPAVYPPVVVAAGTPATATPAPYTTSGSYPVATVRQDQAPAAQIRSTAAVLPAAGVAAVGGVTATPATLTAAPVFPPPVVRQDQATTAGPYTTAVTAWAVVVTQATTVAAALYTTTGTCPAATAAGGAGTTPAQRATTAVFPPLAALSTSMIAALAPLTAATGFPAVLIQLAVVKATARATVTSRGAAVTITDPRDATATVS